MLTYETQGSGGTLVVMLHWLGGSGRTWTEVSEGLVAEGFRCVAVDLPGFGRSKGVTEFSVDAMTRRVIKTIRSLRVEEQGAPWLLAGHSMGGKLAALVARAAQEGVDGLANLRGVVLVSPSPPGPEPMKESKRESTVRSLGPATGDAVERRKHAEKFVEDNVGRLPLLDAVRARAVDDVLRMNPEALVAWMTTGSKVDASEAVGVLGVPALILAGTEEAALGPEVQEKETRPHFAEASVVSLEGGGHLAPLERPWELSQRMVAFFRGLGVGREVSGRALSEEFAALIGSDRTSPQTRKVLRERMEDGPRDAEGFDGEELLGLRALVARVVPGVGFDLAGRLSRSLAQREGDGWRFDELPKDAEAWRVGLRSLAGAARREFGVPFAALDGGRQDELLRRAEGGELGRGVLAALHVFGDTEGFDAGQMRDWFEDVRGEMVTLYMSDPRTMERVGFTGFADEAGFTKITLEEQTGVEL